MTELSKGTYDGATAEMVDELRAEYLADLAEDIVAADEEVAAALEDSGCSPDVTARLRQLAFDVKGQSRNFNLKILNSLAHRLEDYVASEEVLSVPGLTDARKFLDLMSDVLHGDVPLDTDPSQIVRGLPAKPLLDSTIVESRESEILLVMLHGAATKKVQREIQECGYRVNIVTSTFDALPLVVRTKPDLVVISAVMIEMSGVDLAIALKAMPQTRNVPVALITSFGRDHDDLFYLPDSVPIIRKGPDFPDDIAAALEFHFLI